MGSHPRVQENCMDHILAFTECMANNPLLRFTGKCEKLNRAMKTCFHLERVKLKEENNEKGRINKEKRWKEIERSYENMKRKEEEEKAKMMNGKEETSNIEGSSSS